MLITEIKLGFINSAVLEWGYLIVKWSVADKLSCLKLSNILRFNIILIFKEIFGSSESGTFTLIKCSRALRLCVAPYREFVDLTAVINALLRQALF